MKVDFENCSYITDVSFRLESPRQAWKFVYDEIQTDNVCEYKLTQDEYYSNILWKRFPNSEWKKLFGFDESPQSETDFMLPNYYCETHVDSPFTHYPILSIFPLGRHVIISNKSITIFDETNTPVIMNIETEKDFISHCKKYFNIKLQQKHIQIMNDKGVNIINK